MRKKYLTLWIVTIIIVAVALIIVNPFKKDIWGINADKLRDSFNIISGNAIIDDLSEWIPFDWDTLYSFDPYTPKEEIYEIIGYKWDNISQTVNEGMNQIVFVKDNKVVCYLYGYPDNSKLGFNFGTYEGNYIKLSHEHNLSFKTEITQDGVRYFDYISK